MTIKETIQEQSYIVLWKDNSKLGSLPYELDTLDTLNAKFYLSLIQRDITGTEHYEVLAKRCRTTKQ